MKNPTYECFILALTVLSLINLVLLLLIPREETADIIRIVDLALSAIFLLDFGYRLSSAPGKTQYFFREHGWLDLIGSLPIPVLRIARVYRVVAVARLLHPVRHGLLRTMLSERAGTALLGVLFLTVVLLEVASALVLAIEIQAAGSNIHTASDALWWTWVSVTTVGYGDYYPVTNSGRLVGVVTLAVGVGLVGTLTGFLANAFLRPNARAEQEARDREARFADELADIRRQLDFLSEHAISMSNSPAVDTQAATRGDGPDPR